MPRTTPKEELLLKKMDANPNTPRYVNCDLTKQQKESLVVFIQDTDNESLWTWIEMTVGAGHSVSLKPLEVGFQCSVTGQTRHGQHANVCLISRASTAIKSMWSCYYKDSEILKGVWPITNRMEELDV